MIVNSTFSFVPFWIKNKKDIVVINIEKVCIFAIFFFFSFKNIQMNENKNNSFFLTQRKVYWVAIACIGYFT